MAAIPASKSNTRPASAPFWLALQPPLSSLVAVAAGVLAGGVGVLAGGVGTLAGGVGVLAGGVGTLAGGVGTLAGGVGVLAGGVGGVTVASTPAAPGANAKLISV